MKKTLACLVAIAGMVAVASGAVAQTGTFTCQASALRITDNPILPDTEPFTANAGGGALPNPCAADSSGLVFTQQGPVTAGVLFAETSADQGADAHSGVAEVVIKDATGTEVLAARAVTADATGRCVNGQPVLDGSGSIASLTIGGTPIDVAAPPNTMIPIPLIGTLTINYQVRDINPIGNTEKLTVRSLYLQSDLLGDIVIAEAISDYHFSPCTA